MSQYNALIRYEWKPLKWMTLLFTLLACGYVAMMGYTVEQQKMKFLTHIGVGDIRNVIGREINWLYPAFIMLALISIVLLVYLQFRDAKNIEVGRFLKSLPIQNTRLYWVRIGCGIMSYTLPYMLLVGGVIGLRGIHRDWLADWYSLSRWQEELQHVESIGYILMVSGVSYLIITGVYLSLVMMQYLVTNRLFALVVGGIMWCIPPYFGMMSEYNSMNINMLPMMPFTYGILDRKVTATMVNGEMATIDCMSFVGVKVIVLLLVIGVSLISGYMSSKYFKVEDQEKLIPASVPRGIFKIVGTLCIGLVPIFVLALGIVERNEVTETIGIVLSGVLLLVGYWISHQIAKIGCHKK